MDWTEEQIRRAVSWQAFREGKALAERAAPIALKSRDGLATASFRQGKRPIRTVVKWQPHLDVECGCPENRRDGTICAHAVAVLFYLIQAKSNESSSENPVAPDHPQTLDDVTPNEVPSYQLTFAPNLTRQFEMGRCQCQIKPMGTSQSEADRSLDTWLTAHGLSDPKLLSVGQDDFATLLEALRGHPRLLDADGHAIHLLREPIQPVRLKSSERHGSAVRLVVDPIHAAFECNGQLFGWQGSVIGHLPVEDSTPKWRQQAIELLRTGRIELTLEACVASVNQWLDLFASPPTGWLGELKFRRTTPQIRFEIEGSMRALDGRLGIEDGNQAVFHEPDCIEMHAPEAARQAQRRLRDCGFQLDGDSCRLRDADKILRFLADDLPQLEESWQVRVGERLRQVRQSLHVVRPVIHDISQPNTSAALELSFQTDAGKTIPRAKIREILRSGRTAIATKSGAQVVISREVHEQLEPLLADLGIVSTDERITLNLAAHEALLSFRVKSHKRHKTNDLQSLDKFDYQAFQSISLRKYQVHGASWINDRLKRLNGAILADEMGLGKTIQTIASIIRFKQETKDPVPCLIVVPTSLLGNWMDEFGRFAPDLSVVVLHGAKRDERRGEVMGSDVILTSYGTLARDLAFHLRTEYGLLVMDEASVLRNPDSEISRAVAKLKPARRLALTGTPIENRPLDLWAIFRVVAPGYLGGKAEFLEHYENGEPGAIQRLKWRVSPYVLRRTKAEVASDLPERIELDHWLELDSETREWYREVAAAGLSQWEKLQDEGQTGAASMHLLTVILRLRQLCLSRALVDDEESESLHGVKTEWLETTLASRFEENRKTLVFSQFSKYLRKLKYQLNDHFGACFLLDGSTRDRAGMVRAFQEQSGPAVFLISLKAGGYGLNLTAADAVVHMDPWWNPAAEAQASDRAHRIGQDRPVTIHRLLIRDSVEERVRRLQTAKQAVIDDLQGDGKPLNWAQDDLRQLLEL